MARCPLTILHLSDVQFGKDHRFAGAAATGADDVYDTLLSRLVEDLKGLRDETALRPELVLLTGDFAEWGRKSELDDALRFVRGLAEFLGLGRDRVVLNPGNHDVNRDLCEGYFATCAGNEEQPQEPFWPKWSPFVAMFRQFYGDTPGVSMTPDQPWSFFEVPELEAVVAALNSTMKESHREEDHYGWVGEAQLRWFAEQLEPYRERGWWRLAAVHHNVRRGPVRDDENLRDYELFRARLGPLVHAVFHGHTHDGKLDWLSNRVPILATGSAAVTVSARPPEVPNQYQVVCFWPDRFKRWTRMYLPGQLRWVGDTGASPGGDSWWSEEPVVFDLLAPSRRKASGDQEPWRQQFERAPQDDLLARVDRICRLREKNQAEVERLTVGRPPLEYLRISAWDDLAQRVYAVGAIAGDMTAEHLELFVQRVHERYREDDPGARSILVATGAIPPRLLDEARGQHVDLVSFVEFQGLLDLRPYVEKQTAELAADPVYPPELYIPQRLQFDEGQGLEEAGDALGKVSRWLQDPRGRFVLILGDFGTGKTFLLHELARRMGQEDPGLSPILLQMRALEKSRTLDELLSQHFGRLGMDFSPRKFRYMLEQGRVALLVDGFDELAVRVTYPQAAHHFDTLLEAAAGAAKVVVTSRRQHFLTDQEVQTKVETLTGRRIALLQPFDRSQILGFLQRCCGGADEAARRLELLERVEDLMGLSQNPRLLRFIVDLPEEKLEEAAARTGKITAAELYQLLLDRWLLNEEERVSLKGAPPNLTREARWWAVAALALRLWEKTDPAVSLTEIEAEAAQVVRALKESSLDPETAAFQVGSGTLFVRDEEGRFSFLHQSVLEWIVAREAARELATGHRSKALSQREMSRLMVEFFCDLAGRDSAATWARAALGAGGTEAVQSNARQVLRWLGEGVAERRLAGKDLRGQDLAGENLDGADLAGTDLFGANLRGASLRGAHLRGAKLIGADLEGACLEGADLSAADLSEARLTRADLRRAGLWRTILRRARLLAAQIDPSALEKGHLWGAAVELPQSLAPTLDRDQVSVNALSISEDGTLLASGADDRMVRLWGAATGREIRRFEGHRGRVLSVAFAPGGEHLASGADDGTARLWDVATGHEIRRFEVQRCAVTSVAFAPSGEQLAGGANDSTVRLWDTAGGDEIRRFEGHGGEVGSVAFSPGGTLLASGADDGTVRLWDAASGSEIRRFGVHLGQVCVAFSPDGKKLAGSAADGTVHIWEAAGRGREVQLIEQRGRAMLSVAYSPGGERVASGSDDGRVSLWNVASGREIRRFEGHGRRRVKGVAFSPLNEQLASGADDGTLRLWDITSSREIRRFQGHGSLLLSVALSPGELLASGRLDGSVLIWNAHSGREIRRLEGHSPVWSVAFSPDGEKLLTGDSDGIALLWDIATGRKIVQLGKRGGRILSVAFSPDGELMARLTDDGAVEVWSGTIDRACRRLEGKGGRVLRVAFSTAGDLLASTSDEGEVSLWSVATGRLLRRLKGQNGNFLSATFSPNGENLASGGDDGTVRLWAAATGRELQRFEGDGGVWSLTFSPDGKELANGTSYGLVHIWDVATGREVRRLEGHGGAAVPGVTFSADGKQLASAGVDGALRLWEASSGRCLATLASLEEGWVAFAPDGRYKMGGVPAGGFWNVINLCRFEAGELDDLVEGLRLPDEASFLGLPQWTPQLRTAPATRRSPE
jgi:WD40 repeat protein/3',5'-cyclic AMP phosphodiesterase CpdA